jgi:hypothetical protein
MNNQTVAQYIGMATVDNNIKIMKGRENKKGAGIKAQGVPGLPWKRETGKTLCLEPCPLSNHVIIVSIDTAGFEEV